MTTISQKLTPKEILQIFIEQHRIASPLDFEANPEINLTFETTISEWREARDLLPWKKLSEFLNESFGINVSEKEWKENLTPSHKKKLKNVCELISESCNYDDIKPKTIFGSKCLSASVFLTLKKYLERRNVDVSEIRPSTKISPYLEKYYSELLEQIIIISSGKKIFKEFKYESDKRYNFWQKLTYDNKIKYEFKTGKIITFRDLTEKIIETSNQ